MEQQHFITVQKLNQSVIGKMAVIFSRGLFLVTFLSMPVPHQRGKKVTINLLNKNLKVNYIF
jgi:hypothetical protein